MKSWLEMRNGHVWCTKHDCWWKECDCPGDMRTTMVITQDMIDAVAPSKKAIEAIQSVLDSCEAQNPRAILASVRAVE